MFQPEVKLEFVRRYCSPEQGWEVFVDIDASEEGRTGGQRKTQEAKHRQQEMKNAGNRIRQQFHSLGVEVGGDRLKWFREKNLPRLVGDRDVVAFHRGNRICLIAEVEGSSFGQPEQKLYKAIGQLVMVASNSPNDGWHQKLVLVVHGKQIAAHLQRATALKTLNISALALARDRKHDRCLFGRSEVS